MYIWFPPKIFCFAIDNRTVWCYNVNSTEWCILQIPPRTR
nr:MAG TPA: hypothetical protein [Inoviridae sp.]DAU43068.1 MAG TPA: hypothetical protein [Inoviridae sp.]